MTAFLILFQPKNLYLLLFSQEVFHIVTQTHTKIKLTKYTNVVPESHAAAPLSFNSSDPIKAMKLL